MSRIQVPPYVRSSESTSSQTEGGQDWFSLVRRVLPMIIQFKSTPISVPAGGDASEIFYHTTIPDLSALTVRDWALVFSKVLNDDGTYSYATCTDLFVSANGTLTIVWNNSTTVARLTPENKFIMAYRRT